MAINKNIPQGGRKVEYWNISSMNVNFAFKTATIYMLGYTNESQSKDDKSLVTSFEFSIEGDKFDEFFKKSGNQLSQAYKAAMSLPRFEDGETV